MKKLCLVLFLLSTGLAVACPDDEYQECYPILGCVCHKKIGGDVGKAGEQGKEMLNDAAKETEKLGNDTLTTIKKAGGDTVRTLQKAGGDSLATLQKAGGDAVTTFVKAGQDTTATYIKAWSDTAEQTKKSFQDAVDAGTAATNYTINQVKAYEDVLKNAEKRLHEGKVVDSMWGLAVEPMQASEANFAKATQESQLIATAAASAAAAYGGPGGAAAYAAWSTYKLTGNADQALRAGLLAAATAQAGSSVATMPSGTMGEVLKKTALAGAAGGIAVAAAGGDENAIKDGFLKSAGAVLVQAAGDKAKAYGPNAKDAWDTVHCISARDVDCVSRTTWARDAKGKILNDANGKPRIDVSKLDPSQYIGKWSGIDPTSIEGKRNAFMTKISQLPNMEAIPLMKNEWVLTWTAGKSATIDYGQPTVVLTYAGPNPPFNSSVTYDGSETSPPWELASGNQSPANSYKCTLAGIDRTIKVTKKNGTCDAIYRREDGHQDIVWHSDHYPDICASKAAEFVAKMRAKGMKCIDQ
jgi:hypothetical protein